MPAKKKPCTIEGVRYESENVASKALGIHVGVLRNRLGSSNFPNYTSRYHKKVKHRKKVSGKILCSIKGVKYASVSDASRKLKRSTTLIFKRLRSFDFPDYVSADVPKVVEPTKPPRYEVNGKNYRSLQEIGDAEGLTKERIRQKMNSPKYSGYKRL